MPHRPRFAALLAAAVGALWLAFLAGTLGRRSWILDLFANFRVQYAVLFALSTILLLTSRRWFLAALAGVGAALTTTIVLAQFVALESKAASSQPALRVVTFNTWYRNAGVPAIGRYLQSTAADVIVLQELSRARAQQLRPYLRSYPYSFIEPGEAGAVIFSRWAIVAATQLRLTAQGALAARVSIDWRGTPVDVLGVHLHWPLGPHNARLRNEELRAIAAIGRSADQPLIVAGDFNATVWSAHFSDVLSQSPLSDCAHGLGMSPSWPAQFPPVGIRIDHCLASPHWRAVRARTGPALGSDHLPVIADLQLIAGATR